MKNLLNRKESADYLTSLGLKISKQTMAVHAMRGTGAEYTLIGRTAYYKQEWLDEWLECQLTPSAHSFAHMRKEGASDA